LKSLNVLIIFNYFIFRSLCIIELLIIKYGRNKTYYEVTFMIINREIEFRQNFVGEGFLKPPEGNFSRICIFGEIESTQEFLEDNLYVLYEFSLPMGWKVDNENEYYLIYRAEDVEEENINKLKSISQTVKSNVDTFSDIPDSLAHNFSLPFELELLCHNSILGEINPKLLIQVNSQDSWNRHRVEGYCFSEIPIKTGFYQAEIPCYKPKEDNYMRVFSYFLGGSRKIPDLREIAKTSSKDEKNMDTALNRYGIQTEYTGKVNLNLNVVIQSHSLMETERNKIKDKIGRETFLLNSQIESVAGSEKEDEEKKLASLANSVMRTTNFGDINRMSSNN
jgi:hypothetical protein